MSLRIEHIAIRGLHRTRDYNIPIRDNKIVMVGVNGLGKTTVVNLLSLILSRQWERALEYDFDSIDISFDGTEYTLRQEVEEGSSTGIARRLNAAVRRAMVHHPVSFSTSTEVFERLVSVALTSGKDALATELDRMLPLPTSVCRRIALEVNLEPKSFNKSRLSQLDGFLKEHTADCQVLYLPTYRRIEKDLSLIFPDLEESIQTFQRRKGLLSPHARPGYIELVEFGMEDVDGTFRRVRSELIEAARSELNNLAGGYLRDVIRGEGESYEITTFHDLDNATIDRILNRAEERTLSEADKARLRDVIDKLRTTEKTGLEAVDRYIGHFFSKLINVDRALSEREQLIFRFTEVCNKYLTGKRIVYDDKDSSLTVRLCPTDRELPLKSLSSGEKQIVSLFSHLYLRDRGNVLVIIDEPELSLSVTWQQHLLPDILEAGNCHFLAAVTHSPFIFQNELDAYAIDLSECITEVRR